MADLDYGKITVYPGNYDDFMEASSMASRQQQKNANDRAKERIAELQDFVAASRPTSPKGQAGDEPHEADRQAEAGRREALVAPVPVDPLLSTTKGKAAPRRPSRSRTLLRLSGQRQEALQQPDLTLNAGDRRP